MEGLVGLRLIVFQEEKSSGAKASRPVNRKYRQIKKRTTPCVMQSGCPLFVLSFHGWVVRNRGTVWMLVWITQAFSSSLKRMVMSRGVEPIFEECETGAMNSSGASCQRLLHYITGGRRRSSYRIIITVRSAEPGWPLRHPSNRWPVH